MSVIIFLGPTLGVREAKSVLDAEYRPPAAFGDVYRAARQRPSVIGIVDGYFEGEPSVWHKEILWAMTRGVHVFGAASIGALRAAELAPFGMIGIGKIYGDLVSGNLEDDEEVAVSHGPEETSYLKLNEPMVNVRETLREAVLQEVVTREEGATLEEVAKSIFYKKRTYEAIMEGAMQRGLSTPAMQRLRAWLPGGQVDQKRLDALDLLKAIAEFTRSRFRPKLPVFTFRHTVFWDDAQRTALKNGNPVRTPGVVTDHPADEPRIHPELSHLLQLAALARVLATREAERQNLVAGLENQADALASMRRRYSLETVEEIRQWMADRKLSDGDFRALLENEALIEMLGRIYGLEIDEQPEARLASADTPFSFLPVSRTRN